MSAILIIQYVSVIIWSLPPFRQYKGNFFYYFLSFSLCDPLVFVFAPRLRIIPSNIYLVIILFSALISVISKNRKVNWKAAAPVLMALLAIGFSIPNWDISYIEVALLLFILYYSIRYILFFAAKYRYVSLFHFLFLIYNTSLLFKLISAMADPVMGVVYFYSTTIFEILLGILFCILREEDRRFALRLRGAEFMNSPSDEETIARKYGKSKVIR